MALSPSSPSAAVCCFLWQPLDKSRQSFMQCLGHTLHISLACLPSLEKVSWVLVDSSHPLLEMPHIHPSECLVWLVFDHQGQKVPWLLGRNPRILPFSRPCLSDFSGAGGRRGLEWGWHFWPALCCAVWVWSWPVLPDYLRGRGQAGGCAQLCVN